MTTSIKPRAVAPLAAPRGCTNLLVRRFDRLLTRNYDAAVAASGLKTSQYSLLSHIVTLGPIRPGELAQRLSLDASTLTRNLRALIDMGLVEQKAGADARSRSIEATVAGHAKRDEAKRLWKQAQLALSDRLSIERIAALHELIEECLPLLDGTSEQGGRR